MSPTNFPCGRGASLRPDARCGPPLPRKRRDAFFAIACGQNDRDRRLIIYNRIAALRVDTSILFNDPVGSQWPGKYNCRHELGRNGQRNRLEFIELGQSAQAT